jgi:hypothetical protein
MTINMPKYKNFLLTSSVPDGTYRPTKHWTMYWARVKNPHVTHSANDASLDTNVKATGTLEQKSQREGRTRKEKNPEKVGVKTLP